jgi:hypothetical protein
MKNINTQNRIRRNLDPALLALCLALLAAAPGMTRPTDNQTSTAGQNAQTTSSTAITGTRAVEYWWWWLRR